MYYHVEIKKALINLAIQGCTHTHFSDDFMNFATLGMESMILELFGKFTTLITYFIISKNIPLTRIFYLALTEKNIPFFLISAVFDTLNTGRPARASP